MIKEKHTKEEMFDMLVDLGVATEEEISIGMHFNGYNEDTMQEILFYKTGYRSFEQMIEEEEID